jgi:Protein of unknown function (DUF2924)
MPLANQLVAINAMSPPELREAWVSVYGSDVPAIPPSLLARAVAHAAQENRAGGRLPPHIAKTLEAMATAKREAVINRPTKLKPGTRLLRQWNGKQYAVLVTDTGFLLDGFTYRSLSDVARTITGAHWSEPRFFGLKRRTPPPTQQSRHGQPK